MGSRNGARVIGTVLAALVAVASAQAENIPMPRPAPRAKIVPPATRPAQPAPPLPLAFDAQPPPLTTAAGPAAPTPPAPIPVIPPRSTDPAVVRAGTTVAFDARQRAIVDKVSAYLSSIQTLVGNFVQVGPDGSRSEGRFYLQKPGKVRFEYNPPSVIELIADGQAVAVRDRRLATQDIIPLGQTPLRFLLAERIDLMRDTSVVGITADDTFVTVTIEERQTLGGTHRLMLMFGAQDYVLKQWTVTDPQGYDTTVAVYNLDPTKKPDPALFKINYERMLQ